MRNTMLNKVLQAAATLALLAVTALALTLQQETVQRQRLMEEAARELHAQSLSALYTQATVRKAAAQVASEVAGAREDFRIAAAVLAYEADQRMAQAVGVLAQTGAAVNGNLNWLNQSVADVSGPAGQVLSQVSDAASLSLDCDHNADCLHNRLVGTLRGLETAAVAIGEEAPKAAPAATQILENTAEITESCSWLKRLILGCKRRK